MTERKNKASLPGVVLITGLMALPGFALANADISQAIGTPAVQDAATSVSVAHDASPSLTVGGGMAVNPIYAGSARYAPFPSLAAKAVMPSDNWGTFTLSFPEGLRWDLPDVTAVGIALLLGYDPGRKEKIRYLGGE